MNEQSKMRLELTNLTLREKIEKLEDILNDLLNNDYGSQADKNSSYCLLDGIKSDLQRIHHLLDEERAPTMNGPTELSLIGRIRKCIDNANSVHNQDGTLLAPNCFWEHYRGVHIRRRQVGSGYQATFYYLYWDDDNQGWVRCSNLQKCRNEIDQRLDKKG